MHVKVALKIKQVARMRCNGIPDRMICDRLNLTQSGLSRIVALPEYKSEEDAILQGTVSKLDEELAGNSEAMREAFKVAVPAAMRGLIDAVTQRRDLRAMLQASKEILDRDPERTLPLQREAGEGANPTQPGLPPDLLAALARDADKAPATQIPLVVQATGKA